MKAVYSVADVKMERSATRRPVNVLTVVPPADRAPIHGTGPPVRKVLSWTINLYFVFSTVIGIWRYFLVRLIHCFAARNG